MTVVYGRYRWAPRVVAFRNDYCLSCDKQRVSHQVRTFDTLHLFFVPLIPLGFLKRWICATCGSPPHQRIKTSKPMKVLGCILLALVAVSTWLMPIEPGEEAVIWSLRAALPVAAVLAFYFTLKSKSVVGLKERLAKVSPSESTECPICQTALGRVSNSMRCPSCGLERVQL